MNDVTGHFEILVDGDVKTYNRIGDIPLIIDNVIKFQPDIPDGPHSEEQHSEYAKYSWYLQQIMGRDTNGS